MKIEIVKSANGALSLYADNYRICGPKPLVSNETIASWEVDDVEFRKKRKKRKNNLLDSLGNEDGVHIVRMK